MNMSFGVQAAPAATGDVGGIDAPSASSTPSVASAPLPPVPSAFSASFTFQGSSGNVPPPPRPPPAPSGFSFPGGLPRFTYPATGHPSAVPPSASQVPPFPLQSGFVFQGAGGNPGGIVSSQTGSGGQGPAVNVRPFPVAPPQAVAPPPLQAANPQGSQAALPGSTVAPDGIPAHASLQSGAVVPAEAVPSTSPGSLQPPTAQARPVTPLTGTPSMTGLPGQIQMPPSAPSPVGGLAPARPGLPLSSNTTLPYAPSRPAFSPSPGAAVVPPGVLSYCFVLGSAPAGMAPRFPSSFLALVRPPFPRVGAPMVRPPPGALLRPGSLIRPDLSKAAGAYLLLEKPQTLVYVGKIASTVDDDFLRSILELCGPIKSWKRAQEPTTGTPKGFGFCEFELPDGVLRALRLLNGFSLEGQELLITVNQTTREYLERFVQKKKEKELQAKLEASQAAEAEVETAPGVEVPEPAKKPAPEVEEPEDVTEKQEPDLKKFGIVNDEDRETDEEAQKKLETLLEERAKSLPPPPPLPSASEVLGNSLTDTPAKSREGESITDGGKSGLQEVNNEEESIKDKGSSDLEKLDTGSSDQGRRVDYYRDRSRDRDRERDRDIDRGRDRLGRERERERERERLEKEEREEEQSEREREKKRARREKERDHRIRLAERQFENREREWEREEKEKERRRNVDREKEREREKLRKRLIKEQEEGTDDDPHRKVKRRGEYDERKRRQKEKEDDEYDCLKEQEEIAEAKQRRKQEEYEEQVRKRLAEIAEKEAAAKAATKAANDGAKESETLFVTGSTNDRQRLTPIANDMDIEVSKSLDEIGSAPVNMEVDEKISSSPPQKKLGFGLVGSGKRTVGPSVFNQEDEEEIPKERALRELVPIDYSAEEIQVVSSFKVNTGGTSASNLAAAADYAKSLSNFGHNSVREDQDSDHDRGRRPSDRSKTKDKERGGRDDNDRFRDREKEKHRQADGNRETVIKLDTKQLIDMIPKTKDELFAYKIDWKIYDQHQLHDRMKPWIQKKILEFLGEEEETLVEFIVSNTRKHTGAAEMLALLTTILDDEAEMFVMKLWRMLIFEVKKIETGLASKPRG